MIQDIQRQLVELLNKPQSLSSQGESAAAEISHRLELKINSNLSEKRTNPLREELDYIAEHIDKLPGKIRALANAVILISDQLPWYQRPAPEFPAFEAGHANAEIIGPKGMLIRENVIVGLTVMRSGLIYPDHHHPPEEIYIVLSEGLWRQNNNPWKSPGLGGFVYNPPDILHAMKSTETPLFAIWCLKP
jgi:quercetin dioxygenase-like cupin family protein